MKLEQLPLPEIRTPFWARGGHLQTLWAHFLPSEKIEDPATLFTVSLHDGDEIVCEEFNRDSNFIVLIAHGLSGDSSADYMQITGRALLNENIHTVLMNHRGAGSHWPRARYPYHSGRADDLSEVLSNLRSRYPNKKIVTIGFSMSGNIVCLNASGYRSKETPDLAISFNAPIELGVSSRKLHSGFNRLYDLRFVHRLRSLIYKKAKRGIISLPNKIPRFITCARLDDLFTAPTSGFKDRHDYYLTCSSKYHLQNLKIPLWMITTEDDPFVEAYLYRDISPSPGMRIDILPTGGHIGYLHSSDNGLQRWLGLWAATVGKALKEQFGQKKAQGITLGHNNNELPRATF